jgi:beta-phosphoglucomutase-like phosphatase (HAD superfamily)
MTTEAVIFDIDGTLIDSVDLHAQGLAKSLPAFWALDSSFSRAA